MQVKELQIRSSVSKLDVTFVLFMAVAKNCAQFWQPHNYSLFVGAKLLCSSRDLPQTFATSFQGFFTLFHPLITSP